jgi:hypothetical protein
VAEVDRYRQHKVRDAAEITAAAESGNPMMFSYGGRQAPAHEGLEASPRSP